MTDNRLRLYEDKLLPLSRLYSLETVLKEALSEKVWLKSGAFLVIQQTEAFVSIDVNTGKYTEKKIIRRHFGRSIWRLQRRSQDNCVSVICPV